MGGGRDRGERGGRCWYSSGEMGTGGEERRRGWEGEGRGWKRCRGQGGPLSVISHVLASMGRIGAHNSSKADQWETWGGPFLPW